MKDFAIIYRADYTPMATSSPEDRAAMTIKFMSWLDSLEAQGNLVDKGHRLAPTGKVVAAGNIVTNGPYMEVKEFIGGFSIIRAESYDDAVELLKDCPSFKINGKVEIREINYIK